MASKWFDIRVKTEPAKMKYVSNQILGYPEQAFQKYYFQALQRITAEGADIMRNYLNTRPNWTDTGQKRKARGGNGPGRVDTGTMRDSIKWSGKKDAKGRYVFKFGWIDGQPGYSIFQEYGTKNGVEGMHSMEYATEFVRSMIKDLAQNGKGTRLSNPKKVFEE